jgi:hypothetical protein
MAIEQISKIKVRQGDFSDLPLLESGELGYATDARRLFIGNERTSVDVGNGVKTSFVVDIDVNNPGVFAVFVDGSQVNSTDYSLIGTTLTFSTAPANGATIEFSFNNEIDILKNVVRPLTVSLPANGVSAETGFAVDTTKITAAVLDYTLSNTNGVRIGQLRFAINTNASTFTIDDNYSQTATVDVVFNLDIGTTGTAKLVYTDNDNAISNFKFTYQLWKI